MPLSFLVLLCTICGTLGAAAVLPGVYVGGSPITITLANGAPVSFTLNTSGVADPASIYLAFASSNTCNFAIVLNGGKLGSQGQLPGVYIAQWSLFHTPRRNYLNVITVDATLGSCFATSVRATLPPAITLPYQPGAHVNNVFLLPQSQFTVTVGAAGELLQPFALAISNNPYDNSSDTVSISYGKLTMCFLGYAQPSVCYIDTNELAGSTYGGNGRPTVGPAAITLNVGASASWRYVNISIREEDPVALQPGVPVIAQFLTGLSTIFSVPLSQQHPTSVEVQLLSGYCSDVAYNANGGAVVGSGAIDPSLNVSLPAVSTPSSWLLVFVGGQWSISCQVNVSIAAP